MIFTVVAAMTAVGIFSSAVVKLRRNAVAITVLVTILIFAGYGIILANYHWAKYSHGRGPIWQLAAFWPVTPIVVESGGWNAEMPRLWWPKRISWAVVSSAYAMITLALLLATPKMARKFGGVRDEQY